MGRDHQRSRQRQGNSLAVQVVSFLQASNFLVSDSRCHQAAVRSEVQTVAVEVPAPLVTLLGTNGNSQEGALVSSPSAHPGQFWPLIPASSPEPPRFLISPEDQRPVYSLRLVQPPSLARQCLLRFCPQILPSLLLSWLVVYTFLFVKFENS